MRTFNANTGESGDSNGSDSSGSEDQTDGSQSNPSDDDSNDSSTTSQGVNVVELPETALRSFNQRSVIPNGATLVLAGYIEKESTADQSKFANIALLGGKGASTQNVEMVMLITPVILSSNENDAAPVKGYAGQAGS